MMNGVLILFVTVLSLCEGFLVDDFVGGGQVCYSDVGCFSTAAPFNGLQRPLTVLPQSPQDIQTQFLLYTRTTPSVADEEVLSYSDASTITSSHFNSLHPTKIIVHGYTHNGHRQWLQNMKKEFLQYADMNIIIVDWGHGAGLPYTQATANTRVVGKQTSLLVTALIDHTGTSMSNFHVIGHSLGAHIAGYAGENLTHLPHISGLDPADPYFQGGDVRIRLDPTDADFVDVIHTDDATILELGFGTSQPSGHVDFFPNGGKDQPGCDTGLIGKGWGTIETALSQLNVYAAEGAVACSHERSYELYTESINSQCPFIAYPCTSGDEFHSGHCLRSEVSYTSRMGYHAIEFPGRGNLYLETQNTAPFCDYHYQLNVTGKNNMNGIISAVLQGTKGNSSPIQLMESTEVHTQGHTISKFFKVKEDIGNITGIAMKYDKTSNLLTSWAYPEDWNLMGVSLYDGSKQQLLLFCAYGKQITNHNAVSLGLSGTC